MAQPGSEVQALGAQIEALRTALQVIVNDEDRTLNTFERAVFEKRLRRGYLTTTVPVPQLEKAKATAKVAADLDGELAAARASAESRRSELAQMRPPRFFGKTQYESEVSDRRARLIKLDSEVEGLVATRRDMEPELASATAILGRERDESIKLDAQYEQDGAIFATALRECVQKESWLVTVPDTDAVSKRSDGPRRYCSALLRLSLTFGLFDAAGWSNLNLTAQWLIAFRSDAWWNLGVVIDVRGVPVKLDDAVLDFLDEYSARDEQRQATPFPYWVRANSQFCRFIRSDGPRYVETVNAIPGIDRRKWSLEGVLPNMLKEAPQTCDHLVEFYRSVDRGIELANASQEPAGRDMLPKLQKLEAVLSGFEGRTIYEELLRRGKPTPS